MYHKVDDFHVCALTVNERMQHRSRRTTEPISFESRMAIALDSRTPVVMADHERAAGWMENLPTLTINVVLSQLGFSVIPRSPCLLLPLVLYLLSTPLHTKTTVGQTCTPILGSESAPRD
jgi:hypothetical protein